MENLGPITVMKLEDPAFSSLLWKLTPASMAVRLSQGRFQTWNYVQLLSRKLLDVAAGRCKRLIVCFPPRHGKDLSVRTPVTMGDGSRMMLGEVEVGDLVITKRGRARRVLATYDKGELDCVRIRTFSGREIVAELEHPFLTPYGWEVAGQLKKGSGLAILRTFKTQPSTINKRLEEYRMAGYMVGDGCVGSANVYAADEEEVGDVGACARALNLTYRFEDHAFWFSGMRPWLRSTGLAGKIAYLKTVPEWVLTSSDIEVANFIGAYFATDGSVSDLEVVRKSGDREGEPRLCG